jgi:opacity protein-like surface antigen
MLSMRLTFLAAAALLSISTAAHAADYPPPVYTQPQPQPIIVQPAPPVVDCCDSWYLRGHVGIGMTSASQLAFKPNAATAAAGFAIDRSSVSDAYFFGGGVGYAWNHWLRLEATAEYRAKSRFSAVASTNPFTQLNTYDANMKSWLFLANAFVDLGTWNCFTPFVGLGVGASWNQITDFKDVGTTGGRGFGRDTSKLDFAWALYAGVAYNVTKSFTIDFTYRYLNLGDFTDTIDCVGGCGGPPLKYHLDKVHSHDFMIGFRWACCDIPAVAPPIVYAPPPPPLQTRG